MDDDHCSDVLVVGCGFSGAALVRALVTRGVRVTCVERTGDFGPGFAHAPAPLACLLNVPAARMSIDPTRPDDFVDWLRSAGRSAAPTAFVPRAWFGEYVRARLAETVADALPTARPRLLADEVTDLLPAPGGRWVAQLAAGRPLRADTVVLALGNEPPARPRGVTLGVATSARYVAEPFRATERLAEVPRGAHVVCLGTGLTMIDVARLVLGRGTGAGENGPERGTRITAVSRHGLMPRAHGEPLIEGGWRQAIDQLRPHISSIWGGWESAQRRAFLRHVRPYWEVHRHRMAPDVAAQVAAWRASGALEVRKGALAEARVAREGGAIEVGLRDGTQLRADVFVNCTGPNRDPARTRERLVATLLERRILARDPLGLGYQPARAGLHVIGPANVGVRYESTAVPELRQEAENLASALANP